MFITFEGPDGAGKSTQAELLKKNLERQGHKVKLIHFPRYESPIGGLIGKTLSRDVAIDFQAMQMLYVADQLDFQRELEGLLADGYYVLADRYDMSTMAYYMSKMDLSAQSTIKTIYDKWQFLLRKPDITFVFDIEGHLEERREDGSLDLFETDKAIVGSINSKYSLLADRMLDREISVLDAKQSIEDISIEILNVTAAMQNNKSKRRR